MERGCVQVKDLNEQKQEEVDLSKLPSYLHARLDRE